MSTDPTAGPSVGAEGAQGGQPGEEDRSEAAQRAAYEAELSRITSADMMLQAAVSLLNIGSYRLARKPSDAGAGSPPSERDLEQARDAIDGVRALLEILERRVPSEIAPLRNALSQLQMAYAREAQSAGGEVSPGTGTAEEQPASGGTPGAAPTGQQGQGEAAEEHGSPGPGPAESSGRLWVPGR
jgi:hypothetical protein